MSSNAYGPRLGQKAGVQRPHREAKPAALALTATQVIGECWAHLAEANILGHPGDQALKAQLPSPI